MLRDVSFDVEPGERIGLVGATGSGKTTIINLLLRFYDVQRGRILVDGIDVREWDSTTLRGAVRPGAAGRAPVLGHDRAATSGWARAICDDARAAGGREPCTPTGSSSELPGGYDAPVAERGATLSVGPEAAAVVRAGDGVRPPRALLDEATSSIDTATEALIRDALARADAGPDGDRHRAPAVDDPGHGPDPGAAQRGAAGAGTHQELLAERGLYYRLYQLQFQRTA